MIVLGFSASKAKQLQTSSIILGRIKSTSSSCPSIQSRLAPSKPGEVMGMIKAIEGSAMVWAGRVQVFWGKCDEELKRLGTQRYRNPLFLLSEKVVRGGLRPSERCYLCIQCGLQSFQKVLENLVLLVS